MSERAAPSGTLVLGVGNPLMGDDGVGLAALELLRLRWRFPADVELVDGGTWGMNLLPAIEAAERLLVLDAVHVDGHPGALVRLERADLPKLVSPVFSPHQIDLKEVFALAEVRGTLPAEALALGLEPEVVEMRTELSPAVSARLDALASAAVEQLRAWGHQVEPLSEAAATVQVGAWQPPPRALPRPVDP